MSSSRGVSVIEVLIMIVVLVVLVALLFPAVNVGPEASSRAQAKNDVTQIATAVVAFEFEYGHLPGTNSGDVGGETLAALMGNNDTLNPRKIPFLELQAAKKYKSGYRDGNFVDPWGGIYQIAYASGTNQWVKAGTNGIEVRKRVAVWNDPNRSTVGWNWNALEKQKRYVTSWD